MTDKYRPISLSPHFYEVLISPGLIQFTEDLWTADVENGNNVVFFLSLNTTREISW